jgi:hypothetical protein
MYIHPDTRLGFVAEHSELVDIYLIEILTIVGLFLMFGFLLCESLRCTNQWDL